MRHLFITAVLALLTVTLHTSCAVSPPVSEARVISSMRLLPALAWLDGNQNKYALASNRFGPTTSARNFINELLRIGAVQVYVADPMEEESRIKLEGGPYADTLVVSLPKDKTIRAALFKVFTAEAKREGFEPVRDVGQEKALLWWD